MKMCAVLTGMVSRMTLQLLVLNLCIDAIHGVRDISNGFPEDGYDKVPQDNKYIQGKIHLSYYTEGVKEDPTTRNMTGITLKHPQKGSGLYWLEGPRPKKESRFTVLIPICFDASAGFKTSVTTTHEGPCTLRNTLKEGGVICLHLTGLPDTIRNHLCHIQKLTNDRIRREEQERREKVNAAQFWAKIRECDDYGSWKCWEPRRFRLFQMEGGYCLEHYSREDDGSEPLLVLKIKSWREEEVTRWFKSDETVLYIHGQNYFKPGNARTYYKIRKPTLAEKFTTEHIKGYEALKSVLSESIPVREL